MHMYSSPKLYYTYASSKGYNGVRDFYTSPFDSHTFSKFRQTFTFDIYFWWSYTERMVCVPIIRIKERIQISPTASLFGALAIAILHGGHVQQF